MPEHKNIIEMDIWSSFGCFTKPFSNTGGLLTYLIPPKTSIIGMIAAILGYNFDDYIKLNNGIKQYKIEELYDIKISIQAMFDLKVKRVTFNCHYGNEPNLLNIKEDVLINPYYRLYLSFPKATKDKEKEFLEKIKKQETIYNLYMGRNEFFLNYKFKNNFENVKRKIIISEFDSKKDGKIYGTLERSNVEKCELIEAPKFEGTIYERLKKGITRYARYYEYIIRDYPVRRSNFVNFDFSEISFYSLSEQKDCYFANLSLKENTELELYNIGDNKWISLI